ncbi:hypothetical protein HDU85_005099 [Gaertneriomyces sp. JEL0708]|nr:hypothetical protein HDU85_005099 [Gaertneriomyces sp. JEL0708]
MPRLLHWATRTYAAIGASRFHSTASLRPSSLLTLKENRITGCLQGGDASLKRKALACSSSAMSSKLAFRDEYFDTWSPCHFYQGSESLKEKLAERHCAVMRRKWDAFTSGEVSNDDDESVEVYMNVLSEKRRTLKEEKALVASFEALVRFTAESLDYPVPKIALERKLNRSPAFMYLPKRLSSADLVFEDPLIGITLIMEAKSKPCARHHPTNEWDQALAYCVYYAQEFVQSICTTHPSLGLLDVYGLLRQRIFFCTQVLHTVEFYEISLLDLLRIPYRRPTTVFSIGPTIDLETSLGHHHWRRLFIYIRDSVALRTAAFPAMGNVRRIKYGGQSYNGVRAIAGRE